MRNLKLFALAMLIGTAGMFAAETVNPDVPKKVIRNQIVKLLTAPEFSVDKEMTVNITFTFSSEGEIVVLNVDSRNRNVLTYIRENLNYKKIENPGERDKIYSMPLKVATA
jgi:hypothetical protein